MSGLPRLTITTALLIVALLPIVASMSPEAAGKALDSTIPLAIAQPLASADGAAVIAGTGAKPKNPVLPESGMLLIVGSALLGLAAVVRRTT